MQVPQLTRERQDVASRPKASAWVSANAGSGKTFVLSRRVVRLLLDGTDPSRILALTFTKAAAAEMATRVFKILGSWVAMDDATLAAELTDIEGAAPGRARLAMARKLFARALETPGGLKIQTIHGFCEALLHQFPLEANVAGHFTVLDDRVAGELMEGARAAVLQAAETDPESVLGEALRTVIDLMSDGGAQKALEELIQNRDALQRWLIDAGGLDTALSVLAQQLDIDITRSLKTFDEHFRTGSDLIGHNCLACAEALRTGTKTDIERADALTAANSAVDHQVFRAHWLPIFLTAKHEPRKNLATKKVAEAFPHVVEQLVSEQARLMDLLEKRRALVTFEGSSAVLRLAHAVIGSYERLKAARGFLDFEDLVVKTAHLLSRSDASQWVQYKMDQGLDHILVDEAQDTSPRQWEVVTSLAQEFFTGEGANARTRTLFAVGDEKQSIYSFQGAVPAYFDLMRRSFETRAKSADMEFHSVELQLSFRSTPDVLGAVDKVFLSEEVHRGLSQETRPPVHEAIRKDPGIVDIWPLEVVEETQEPEDWRTPVDHVGKGNPMTRVARRIAATIKGWMRDGIAAPGDVMILLRKRGPFVDVLNRELKQQNIPAAGSDRLTLTDHIAVQDLVALGRFLLLPEDDLSLACVLKSPLFDLTDEHLFDVARDRPDLVRAGTLWQSIVKRSSQAPLWKSVRETIEKWRAGADFMPPFEFYARLLSADGGRRAFRTRLGDEVDDVLDEFLTLTISYEQAGTPGLEGFLAWMASAPAEIKRELTNAKGMVRIMTVHGSKGLESKIVILVDPGSAPFSAQHDPAFLPMKRGNDDARPPALIWLPSKAERTGWHDDMLQDLRQGTEEEYRRLLYVALTRAEDRLVVCGWEPKRGAHEQCWHTMVRTALAPEAEELVDQTGAVTGWRWQRTKCEVPHPETKPVEQTSGSGCPSELPVWLNTPVAPVKRRTRLQPSKAFEAMEQKEGIEPVSPALRLGMTSSSPSWALERGRIVHRLLEILPDLPAQDHESAAQRIVASALPEVFASKADDLVHEVLQILRNDALSKLFQDGGRPEVPIVGTIASAGGKEIQVSGQIDRLVVEAEKVTVFDYKTNAVVPETAAAVSLEYLAQLSVYRELLKRIYPGKAIEAALLWTTIPRLMTIPADILDDTFRTLQPDGTSA
ncbi:DNA helicase/exodeoxyribonuclease V subunit A [Roseibium hamelinense]|uniref:DNA 3'-5' helicase n=1 Tax=Roseibium hamelinense TaxID=150831 RepID=A0A562T0T7_9HYPH|nr:double-strand break repair helicase AddA [Roseibium hamelinense]MTI44563.1 double-strand break repair helicase AddA [Roseibium hamelinense]TWI87189.1 DNA helicase/exodeoxyribonuclease V subunit A [Roseibium hamelinense]